MTTEYLLMHRTDDRHARYLRLPGIFWSDELRCWICCDPETIGSIQKNPAFQVVSHRDEAKRIYSRLGIDLSNIADVFDQMPLSVEGTDHAAKRKRTARTIASKTAQGLADFRNLASELVKNNLGQSGQAELVESLFEPLVSGLVFSLTGIRLEHDPNYVSPTQIFDRSLGLQRRKLINQRLGEMRHQARGNSEVDDVETALVLAVLGTDSILGSLSLSFIERVSANPGKRLDQIAWGEQLSQTAVPFIERTAVSPVSIEGKVVDTGEVVRLYLDRFSSEPPECRNAFFGTGRHSCIGRPITLNVWRILGETFSESPFRIRIDSVKYREADVMFLFPREIKVTVHE